MLEAAGSGHPGGSLSSVEILIALYYYKFRHNPKDPKWEDRDKFVLSKGHCCPALYTVLAHRGFFPKEELLTFRKLGSRLQGHAYIGVPGVEASTGSLGQGFSIANGMAMAARYDGKNSRIYCLMGDGEIDEGRLHRREHQGQRHGEQAQFSFAPALQVAKEGDDREQRPGDDLNVVPEVA